jgi:hypothetical protein
MEQQISLALCSLVGFSNRVDGFLLEVSTKVNWSRLQDQIVSTMMHNTLLVLTFSS